MRNSHRICRQCFAAQVLQVPVNTWLPVLTLAGIYTVIGVSDSVADAVNLLRLKVEDSTVVLLYENRQQAEHSTMISACLGCHPVQPTRKAAITENPLADISAKEGQC